MGLILLIAVIVLAVALLLAFVKLILGIVFVIAAIVVAAFLARRISDWWHRSGSSGSSPSSTGRSPSTRASDRRAA